jgi:hypothetical protein
VTTWPLWGRRGTQPPLRTLETVLIPPGRDCCDALPSILPFGADKSQPFQPLTLTGRKQTPGTQTRTTDFPLPLRTDFCVPTGRRVRRLRLTSSHLVAQVSAGIPRRNNGVIWGRLVQGNFAGEAFE